MLVQISRPKRKKIDQTETKQKSEILYSSKIDRNETNPRSNCVLNDTKPTIIGRKISVPFTKTLSPWLAPSLKVAAKTLDQEVPGLNPVTTYDVTILHPIK